MSTSRIYSGNQQSCQIGKVKDLKQKDFYFKANCVPLKVFLERPNTAQAEVVKAKAFWKTPNWGFFILEIPNDKHWLINWFRQKEGLLQNTSRN